MNIILRKMKEKNIKTKDVGVVLKKSQPMAWKICNGKSNMNLCDAFLLSSLLNINVSDIFNSIYGEKIKNYKGGDNS